MTRPNERWRHLCCDAVAAVLIVLAALTARQMNADLQGAYDPDHFRDIAQAQTVRDGQLLADPYYRGEAAWYNPLLAWTLAAGSAASGSTVEQFHVHQGYLLNLLGPIALYWFASATLGRKAGVVALTLFLFFITGRERSWAAATYSPWVFTANFALGFFFVTALVMAWADARLSRTRASVTGALVGLTFLAHTAPGLILALMAAILWWRRWPRLALAGLAAAVVAAPFLGNIAFRYHFHIVNAVPLTYQYAPVSSERLGELLRTHWLLLVMSLAGLWIARSRIMAAWSLAAVCLTGYAMFPLTPLVPAFHFWLYITAAFALLTGAAVTKWANPYLSCGLAIVAVAWHWGAYTTRPDFQLSRFLSGQRHADHVAAAALLRTVTSNRDVVVARNGLVRLVVGVAGRPTVAADPLFSNPYVDVKPRARHRDEMLSAIGGGDSAAFHGLGAAYDVAAAVVDTPELCDAATQMFPLTWRVKGDICISVVRDRSEVER